MRLSEIMSSRMRYQVSSIKEWWEGFQGGDWNIDPIRDKLQEVSHELTYRRPLKLYRGIVAEKNEKLIEAQRTKKWIDDDVGYSWTHDFSIAAKFAHGWIHDNHYSKLTNNDFGVVISGTFQPNQIILDTEFLRNNKQLEYRVEYPNEQEVVIDPSNIRVFDVAFIYENLN